MPVRGHGLFAKDDDDETDTDITSLQTELINNGENARGNSHGGRGAIKSTKIPGSMKERTDRSLLLQEQAANTLQKFICTKFDELTRKLQPTKLVQM